jgi:transposase-like protein
MKYYEAMRGMSRNKFDVRLKMVKIAKNRRISEAARIFETTRNTVRKWLVRYREEGLSGLKEKSRAPKSIPQKAAKGDRRADCRFEKDSTKLGTR